MYTSPFTFSYHILYIHLYKKKYHIYFLNKNCHKYPKHNALLHPMLLNKFRTDSAIQCNNDVLHDVTMTFSTNSQAVSPKNLT